MSREEQIEADATKHRLDAYPGLEEATLAAMDVVQAGQGAYGRYERAIKAAMDALSSAGWRFKPAKKVRTKVRTLAEVYWDELDRLVELLMSDHETEVPREELAAEARGVAFAIAHIQDPYAPSVEAVRAEAMERWEAANGSAE